MRYGPHAPVRAKSRSGAPPLIVWLFAAVGLLALWVWWSSGSKPDPESAAALASVEAGTAPEPSPGPPSMPEPRNEPPLDEPEEWTDWAPTEPEPEPAEPGPTRPPVVTFSWYEGAEGYRRAIEEQAGTHRPLVVYFYTDWCPYCRRLDQGLLIDDEVKDYLRELIKVKINPENGTEERQIANGFGVRGYPSLFAKGYKRREFVRLRPSYRLGSVVHYQTPGEFVSSLQAATGYGSG